MTSSRTVVHVVRHGEVHNPDRVLYGRLPDYHLSDRGLEMAQLTAQSLADRDVTVLVSSPLERAQETAGPLMDAFEIPVRLDERLLEAENFFEGKAFTTSRLREPAVWPRLINPFRPSWGEAYSRIASRMKAALEASRDAARGHEAVLVSHQLPIETLRRHLSGERLWHDPRRRRCNLSSVTSFTFDGDDLTSVSYTEPARALYADASAVPGA